MALIETSRLTLRRLSEDDAPFMLGLLNEPSFIRNIGDRGVRTIDDARTYIELGPMASYTRFGFGLYLVELKGSATPMRLLAIVSPDNGGSIRLLERLGFRFETMVPSPDGRGELRLFAAGPL